LSRRKSLVIGLSANEEQLLETINSQLRLLDFLRFDWLKNSDYQPIVGVLRHMKNIAPSLKIFRRKFSTSALYNGRHWQVSGAVSHKNSRDIR